MKNCVKEYLLDIQIKGYTKATLKNKRNALNHFADWCTEDIEDIRPVHIKQFIQLQMEKGLQPASINFYLKQLKAFFLWCKEEEQAFIRKSPTDNIKLLRQEKTMIKTYSDKDVKALLGYYNGKTYLHVRNKTMIMILVETGIRNNELCSIKLEDMYDDVIKVSSKGKTRFVPISIHLKKQILRYLRVRDAYDKATECSYLLVSTMGGGITTDVPLNVLKKAGNAIGIDVKILVHSMRRYYAQTM
jgi:integrase/recombinase XerD